MKKPLGFLKDPSGDFSVMRLIFLIGFVWLFVADTYLIITESPLSEISTFTGVTGGILAGLKVVQKKYEEEGTITNTATPITTD